MGYSPSFSLIWGVEVWVEIPGFWLLSIRDVWWAEKQFGSGYKALIFCLFLISERLGKALGLERLLHLWSSRIPAGSSHTTAMELEKRFTFLAHSYSGTFFRPRIKNPLDWAIKLRLFSRTFVLFLSVLIIPFFLLEGGEGMVWDWFFSLLLSCLLRNIYLTARCYWRLNMV